MPLTDFQRGVVRLIAANRKPESHVAGGAVLNRGEAGLRISDDVDNFHDAPPIVENAAEIVRTSAERDAKLLAERGVFSRLDHSWRRSRPGYR